VLLSPDLSLPQSLQLALGMVSKVDLGSQLLHKWMFIDQLNLAYTDQKL